MVTSLPSFDQMTLIQNHATSNKGSLTWSGSSSSLGDSCRSCQCYPANGFDSVVDHLGMMVRDRYIQYATAKTYHLHDLIFVKYDIKNM